MKKVLIISFLMFVASFAQEKVLDDFESIDNWKIYKAEGVDVKVSSVKGFNGNAIKLDYNFVKGAGYGGIQKIIHLNLPENYQFSFWIKAESPDNNLEFKLIDKSGDNVWWINNRNYSFPKAWKKVVIKKRKINFAWGPIEDKNLKAIDRLEFTIASYVGGKGTVYLDDLKFVELPPVSNKTIEPTFYLYPSKKKINFDYTIKKNEQLLIDLNGMNELGGLKIEWNKTPQNIEVLSSVDLVKFENIEKVELIKNDKTILYLPELETKYLLLKSFPGEIKNIEVLPVDYSSTINRFFINKAKEFDRGLYPRYLYEQGSFWTVVGWDKSEHEALLNEDGMIEVDKKNFSIEPFISVGDSIYRWINSTIYDSLKDNYLPLPSVQRDAGGISLTVSPFAYGENDNSRLNIIYKVKNNSNSTKSGKLLLSVRPFQVLPYYQDLNITGGFAKITSIKKNNSKEYLVNDKKVYLGTTPNSTFIYKINSGEINNYLDGNSITNLSDDEGFLSSGFIYQFNLKPGEEIDYTLVIPFEEQGNLNANFEKIKREQQKATTFWTNKLNKVEFNIHPDADKIINTIKSNLAYILINKDGAGIQPGSRTYERSWIRDGSLTSSALLKMGIVDEVKEFINWYCKYQYDNGKVPCVVDKRGADPTPENDSHGELIYLIKTYFNFTNDTLFLDDKYKNVVAAAKYIKELIEQRSTDYYNNGNDSLKALYGLLPESISHEGYSAKPMHSYWDDFFALKGLKDAADIAIILNKKDDIQWLSELRDTFKKNLYNSIQRSIKNHNIDYIPGAAELGDFDATSTTIALYPVNELNNFPQPYLDNTFEKYYENFTKRKNSRDWINYTPYENRVIGSFIFLNKPERAHELIDWFLKDTKPYNWNQWAEVVWSNDREPKMIGDMPHTWCGSDFINSARTLFVYEDEFDSSLVIGAGLKKIWLDYEKGLSVKNLPTYYGLLSYTINKNGNDYIVDVSLNGNMYPQFTVRKFPLVIKIK
ncbi:MAG TPA: hypothetical protein VFF33_08890 [Ignavibacteriaceae bacterium]|nr:hypothetical protein [Ignavibacteriaceae bacterium]